MIKLITTLLLALNLISFNQITQALKKILGLLTKMVLKFINLLGIKIYKKEHCVKTSPEFKKTYKDIKKVKLSKKNVKQKSSIDWVGVGILSIAGLLIILNMNNISGNAISNWIFHLIAFKFVKTEVDMNVMYTAVLFSTLSFAANRILTRWKQTKQQRKENKKMKLKIEALKYMDSKELLDNARKKDEEKRKELKK